MFWRHVLIGLIIIGLAAPASAEFYRYIDENGVLRYTDTYMDIPVEQRQGVTPFIETEGESLSKQAAEKDADDNAPPAEKPTGAPAAEQQELRKVLIQKKQELDRSHAQLSKERQALEKEKETISMSDRARAVVYRDKVIDFNRRMKAHQQQVETFTQQVEAFNKRARAAEKAER